MKWRQTKFSNVALKGKNKKKRMGKSKPVTNGWDRRGYFMCQGI